MMYIKYNVNEGPGLKRWIYIYAFILESESLQSEYTLPEPTIDGSIWIPHFQTPAAEFAGIPPPAGRWPDKKRPRREAVGRPPALSGPNRWLPELAGLLRINV